MRPTQMDDLIEQLNPAFVGKLSLSVENVTDEVFGDLRFVLCDVTVTWNDSGTEINDNKSLRKTKQTIALFSSPKHRFPRFSLQPIAASSTRFSSVKAVSSELVGYSPIEFPSHPRFSDQYLLTGTYAENTRRVFDDSRLLDELDRTSGFSITSSFNSLILFRDEHVCSRDERKAFAKKAGELFLLFEDAAKAAQGKPALTPPDPHAYIASLKGLVGSQLRKAVITRKELSGFTQQSVPRTIPSCMRDREGKDVSSFLLISVAIVMTFALAGVLVIWSQSTSLSKTAIFGNIVAVLFIVVILTIIWKVMRRRSGQRQLLRDGTLTTARIESLESTGFSVGDVADYRASVKFNTAGATVRATCIVKGPGWERARLFMADRQAAPILYNPDLPEQVLFLEDLLTLSPEIEP